MKHLLVLSFLLLVTSVCAKEPLSVVVIGGGPVGLSAAIEAVDSGAQVTVVEKREEYARRQRVFLSEESIQLLARWHVPLASEYIFGGEGKKPIAVAPIHVLEELLEKQARKRGVRFLKGEFKAIEAGKSLRVAVGAETISVTYDLLVAADGSHSTVRQETGIPLENFGEKEGAFAWIQLTSEEVGFAVTEPIVSESGFIRRIQTPGGSIIFSQGSTQGVDELLNAAVQQGWKAEAQQIREGIGAIAGGISLSLQQARHFSDSKRSVILLGDAAATGSFFLGLGLNMGFETARNSGDLFQGLKSGIANPYPDFEVKMRETTNSLIEANRFLFLESKSPTLGAVHYVT